MLGSTAVSEHVFCSHGVERKCALTEAMSRTASSTCRMKPGSTSRDFRNRRLRASLIGGVTPCRASMPSGSSEVRSGTTMTYGKASTLSRARTLRCFQKEGEKAWRITWPTSPHFTRLTLSYVLKHSTTVGKSCRFTWYAWPSTTSSPVLASLSLPSLAATTRQSVAVTSD